MFALMFLMLFGIKKIHIVNLSYVEDFPTNVLVQKPMTGSCQYFTNVVKGNVHSTWDNNTYSKWINMASLVERRNKGKAPTQGYSQDKRLPARQPFVMHEGESSGDNPSRSTSLQEFVPIEVTYSSGHMVVALQEVLSRTLQFHMGVYSELPNSIKFILDNLQAAFTLKHHTHFQKTLQALNPPC